MLVFLMPNHNFKKLLILRIGILFATLLLSSFSICQTPSFIHFNVKSGLPSNLVHCGIQDSKGYLWFATDKGLSFYNGKKFQNYDMTHGLPDPEVINLMEDVEKRIWISCFRKRLCYVNKRKIYTEKEDFNLRNISLEAGICNFFEDIDSSIWISKTDTELYRFKNKNVVSVNLPSSIVQVQRIDSALLALGSGYIFEIKESGGNVELFDMVREFGQIPTYSGVSVSKNKVLFSFFNGLLLLEYKNKSINLISNIPKPIGRVFTDRQGRFWVCSPAIGAICFDNNKQDLSNPKLYLAGKKTIYMFEDHQGTFWFCTMDDGIYALPQETPVNYSIADGFPSNNIMSVSRDHSGNILCGDDEGNLNVIGPKNIEPIRYNSIDGYNRILNVLPDKQHGKWVVTDEGLYYDSQEGRKKIDIKSASPKVILPQGDNIWVGTSAYLYLVSTKTLDTFPAILAKRITALGLDSEQNVWAGGIEGVYCSIDSFHKNWGDEFPALRSRIVSIQGGSAGEIWVVTPENGLLKGTVAGGKMTQLLEVNDVLRQPIVNIQSVFKDENERLWLATNSGIYSVNPQNWNVEHFNHYDGLANSDVRSVFVYKDTLWAGTASGVTRVLLNRSPVTGDFPTYITAVHYQRQKSIHEIQIQDSIPPDQEIILPPDASLVEIEFTGLDYRSRGNLTYECQIKEVLLPFIWWTTDNLSTWFWSKFEGKTDTSLVYRANLNFGVSWPAARYNIKVTTLTAGKVRSYYPDKHTFIMRPQWYATLWSYILVWGMIGSVLYRIYQTRVQLGEMTIAVAKSRLFALQSQINPHFVGNAINAIQRFFYPPDPEKASIYSATLTRMLRQSLYFSEKTFVSFREEIEFDRDYLELTRFRLGKEKFHYTFAGVEAIHEDMPFPALFLQPILENAAIHGFSRSGVSFIEIAFHQQNGRLFCIIADNGPGITPSTPAEQHKSGSEKRRSKGNEMLWNKVETLNQLYDLDLTFTIRNASPTDHNPVGTRVIVSYNTEKAIKAQTRQTTLK